MWIVYDKNENIQDKLTTVYSGISFLRNCGILMLINAKKDHADLYVHFLVKAAVMQVQIVVGLLLHQLEPRLFLVHAFLLFLDTGNVLG